MITGSVKNQIDSIWNAFWSGGISNPLEVIEQITYLLFLKRLDELQTLAENKVSPARETHRAAGVFPKGEDPKGRPFDGHALVEFQEFRAGGDVRRRRASTSSRSFARSAATIRPTRIT